MSVRQQLLWMPQTSSDSSRSSGSVPFKTDRPTRVWTILPTRDGLEPVLPFAPVHLHTAFLEDYVHDWIVRGGRLHYFSRAVDLRVQGVWLLLEYES